MTLFDYCVCLALCLRYLAMVLLFFNLKIKMCYGMVWVTLGCVCCGNEFLFYVLGCVVVRIWVCLLCMVFLNVFWDSGWLTVCVLYRLFIVGCGNLLDVVFWWISCVCVLPCLWFACVCYISIC